MTLREYIIEELKEFENNENYYGSDIQIGSERFIIKQSFKDYGIEMKYNECLEEFFIRILKETKDLI